MGVIVRIRIPLALQGFKNSVCENKLVVDSRKGTILLAATCLGVQLDTGHAQTFSALGGECSGIASHTGQALTLAGWLSAIHYI